MLDRLILNIKTFYRNLVRAAQYARFGYSNPDWDYAYFYELMAWKLKRIERSISNSCVLHQPESIRALKRLIGVCSRLGNDEYAEKYFKKHDEKWGEQPRPMLIEISDSSFSQVIYRDRPNVKTAKDRDKEKDEFRACDKKGERDRQKDLKLLYGILKEYSHTWWG